MRTKPENLVTTPAIPAIWGFADVKKLIPDEWNNATFCVRDGCGRLYPVKRIQFSVDTFGKRVIAISASPDEIKVWT